MLLANTSGDTALILAATRGHAEVVAALLAATGKDGVAVDLNLVAKEYAAARRNRGGVLVLSEFTGASVVLDGAVLTNPYSNRRMDDAIESALEMDEEEQRDRMSRMTDAVESYTVSDWADEQISGLSSSTPQ